MAKTKASDTEVEMGELDRRAASHVLLGAASPGGRPDGAVGKTCKKFA